jgi:hypothetical protein
VCQGRIAALAQDTLDSIDENSIEIHHGFLNESFLHKALVLFFGGRAFGDLVGSVEESREL